MVFSVFMLDICILLMINEWDIYIYFKLDLMEELCTGLQVGFDVSK